MFFGILHKKRISANFLEKCQKPGFFSADDKKSSGNQAGYRRERSDGAGIFCRIQPALSVFMMWRSDAGNAVRRVFSS